MRTRNHRSVARGTGTPACAPTIIKPDRATNTIGLTTKPHTKQSAAEPSGVEGAGFSSPVSSSLATRHSPLATSSSTNHQSPVTSHPAKVFLIGAGPGDPELLTVKALRILQSADIVLHDSLIGPQILDLLPASAQRVDVGKRAGFRLLTQSDINSLLVDAATKHNIVVRLKGGDPLLFGRAAEEIEALRAVNIPFEVVPGISAAFGAAAAARVSLTDRRLASHVLFTTFSRAPESQFLPGIGLTAETTVVVYMPGPDYAEVSRWLQNAAVSADTPVLVISKASRPDQSQHATSVAGLARLAALPAPALLIVGRVAASAADAAVIASTAQSLFHDSVSGAIVNARLS